MSSGPCEGLGENHSKGLVGSKEVKPRVLMLIEAADGIEFPAGTIVWQTRLEDATKPWFYYRNRRLTYDNLEGSMTMWFEAGIVAILLNLIGAIYWPCRRWISKCMW